MPKSRNSLVVDRAGGHAFGAVAEDVGAVRPNPEVARRAERRVFSIADRLRILSEADACSRPGEIGALLRREGLYASTLGSFRKQRDSGKLGVDPAAVREKRLEKEAARQRDVRKIAALEAENKKLKVLLELQKKVAELMNLSLYEPIDS